MMQKPFDHHTAHFLFLLARTENGSGYVAMFTALLNVLPWLNIDKERYKVRVVCMDHHDGLMTAAKEHFKIGNLIHCNLIVVFNEY